MDPQRVVNVNFNGRKIRNIVLAVVIAAAAALIALTSFYTVD